MAGALKFSGLSSSLVNPVYPLSPSSIATSSVKPSMTALPLCAPTACVLPGAFRVPVTWVVGPGLFKVWTVRASRSRAHLTHLFFSAWHGA